MLVDHVLGRQIVLQLDLELLVGRSGLGVPEHQLVDTRDGNQLEEHDLLDADDSLHMHPGEHLGGLSHDVPHMDAVAQVHGHPHLLLLKEEDLVVQVVVVVEQAVFEGEVVLVLPEGE